MIAVIWVGVGGALGAMCRYGLSLLAWGWANTLAVNVLGSSIIGALAHHCKPSSSLWLFGATGFCGGLTTFSAFSWETLKWLQQGHLAKALFYVLANLVLSLMAVGLGFHFSK